jgi:hypothetical protein
MIIARRRCSLRVTVLSCGERFAVVLAQNLVFRGQNLSNLRQKVKTLPAESFFEIVRAEGAKVSRTPRLARQAFEWNTLIGIRAERLQREESL